MVVDPCAHANTNESVGEERRQVCARATTTQKSSGHARSAGARCVRSTHATPTKPSGDRADHRRGTKRKPRKTNNDKSTQELAKDGPFARSTTTNQPSAHAPRDRREESLTCSKISDERAQTKNLNRARARLFRNHSTGEGFIYLVCVWVFSGIATCPQAVCRELFCLFCSVRSSSQVRSRDLASRPKCAPCNV